MPRIIRKLTEAEQAKLDASRKSAASDEPQIREQAKSKRKDGRGHWPAGVPRNDVPDEWPEMRKQLAKLLQSPDRRPGVRDDKFVRSKQGLARYLQVSERTIRRWLTGEDQPPAAQVKLMRTWQRHWQG